MIDKYKDELLQSFLDNYCRIYLIDLEEDSIVKFGVQQGLQLHPAGSQVFFMARDDGKY